MQSVSILICYHCQQIFAMHIVTFNVGIYIPTETIFKISVSWYATSRLPVLFTNVTEESAASIFREQVNPCRMKQEDLL